MVSLSYTGIMELTYTICSYGLHATICHALRLEYDDVSERIVEIAAPDGGAAADIMQQISR